MGQAKRGVPGVAAVDPPAGGRGAPGPDSAGFAAADSAGFAVEDAAPLGRESIGAYLARQRRLRGISLEELAQSTRIPLRSLQRLESGVHDADPDGFVRGFVRTVAAALGLPPDETIARMLPEADADGGRGSASLLRRLARAMLWAAALGALAALGWLAVAGRDRTPLRLPGAVARPDGLLVRRDAVRALAEEAERRGILRDADALPPFVGPPQPPVTP